MLALKIVNFLLTVIICVLVFKTFDVKKVEK